MRASYRDWLERQAYANNTIQAQLHRAGRVEKHYGDLDDHYDRDGLQSVISALRYSSEDARNLKPNPSKIPFTGDVRNNLASYRNAIQRYCRFRRDESGTYPAPLEGQVLEAEGASYHWTGSDAALEIRRASPPPPTGTLASATAPRAAVSNTWQSTIGPEANANLAAAVVKAAEVLSEIQDALGGPNSADQKNQIHEAWSSAVGIGHNNPPPDLDVTKAIVEQAIEALNDAEPNVARLQTVHAALKWIGDRFTTFIDALVTLAAPALVVFLASKLPHAIELFDNILALLR